MSVRAVAWQEKLRAGAGRAPRAAPALLGSSVGSNAPADVMRQAPPVPLCALGRVLCCESRVVKRDSRGSREHPWTSLGGEGTTGSHVGGSLGTRPPAACGTLPAPAWRLLPRVRSWALLSHPGAQGLALLGGCQSPLGHPSLPGMYPGGRGGREPFPSLCLQLGAEGRLGDGCGELPMLQLGIRARPCAVRQWRALTRSVPAAVWEHASVPVPRATGRSWSRGINSGA